MHALAVMTVGLLGALGLLAREAGSDPIVAARIEPRVERVVAEPRPVLAPSVAARAATSREIPVLVETAEQELVEESISSDSVAPIHEPVAAPKAIEGRITDAKSGESLAGVTIIVSSPAMQGMQAAISDETGSYAIAQLPPGNYLVTFYYNELTVERPGVTVTESGTTPVYQQLALDTPRYYDPPAYSEGQGITIDKNYIKNIPVPGRTFESALGAAAGTQSDPYSDDLGVSFSSGSPYEGEWNLESDQAGVSFSGGTSLDNTYIVDE